MRIHSLGEYFPCKIDYRNTAWNLSCLHKWTTKSMFQYFVCYVYSHYFATVFVSVFLFVWGALPQKSVCVSFQKPFPFHLGLELSYFPHYFPKKCGGKFAYWWNWKQHWGTNMPAHSERVFDRSLNEGGIVEPFIVSDCVLSGKGVISSLFYFIMKPKLLQLAVFLFAFLFSYPAVSCDIGCLHRDHCIWLQLLCALFKAKACTNHMLKLFIQLGGFLCCIHRVKIQLMLNMFDTNWPLVY